MILRFFFESLNEQGIFSRKSISFKLFTEKRNSWDWNIRKRKNISDKCLAKLSAYIKNLIQKFFNIIINVFNCFQEPLIEFWRNSSNPIWKKYVIKCFAEFIKNPIFIILIKSPTTKYPINYHFTFDMHSN